MTALLACIGAALAETAGCFAFWAWRRPDRPIWWPIPGMAALVAFAYLLSFVDSDAAGRASAAYGGVTIVASIAWPRAVEGRRPDRWDILGGAVCLLGSAVNPPRGRAALGLTAARRQWWPWRRWRSVRPR